MIPPAIDKQLKTLTATIFILVSLASCGGGDGVYVEMNGAPTASGVGITDDNGGSADVGDSLTGSYSYNDAESDAEGTSTFRWLRGGTAISGATGITYTLTLADSSQSITFEITPVAITGTTVGSKVTSTAITVSNTAPTASSLNITDDNGGSALVGDSLTGSYSYSDADNDAEGTSTFRWLRGGTAISGATGITYILISADSGQPITFEVTPVAATGNTTGSPVTSGAISVINNAPTASGVTIIDDNGGSALVGDSLTGSYAYNDTDGDAEGTSTYRWLRGGTAISGATANTYTLALADGGQSITFEVTPVAQTGFTTGNAVTSGVFVSNAAPTATGVNITDDNGGVAKVGDSLTGSYTYSDKEGNVQGTSTYRWLRGGTAISGATASSYTLVSADSGQSITFEVTPIALTGSTTGGAVTSGGITVNSVPTATGVNITDDNGGAVLVGESLTGNYTYNDAESDAEGGSTFRWLRAGTPIGGALASTYTLVLADIGESITFEVTPIAATGSTNGNPVTSAGITVNSPPWVNGLSITDDNLGNAVAGDSLTGNYTYNDADSDAEGATTYRWMLNNVAINAANTTTYTLLPGDVPALITFEVTPVAATGDVAGSPVISPALATGTPPVVSGLARYLDVDGDGISSLNDQIIVPFDQPVFIGSGVASSSDFDLPVSGDSYGTTSGASSAGPGANEITITLGLIPTLKTRQDYAGVITNNSPSGIDVSTALIALDAVEGLSGIDAVASTAIDIVPAYVDTNQSMGANFDSFSVALGDIDGDGDLDKVVANAGKENRVYTNNGNGVFTDSGQLLGGINASYSVTLGDVDEDGDLDMVVANWGPGNTVYKNNGAGIFADTGQSLGGSQSYALALGDIDNDGDLDMVVANRNVANRVYTNDGTGAYTVTAAALGANDSRSVALGDIDADGDLDMVVANAAPQGNRIYTNDGTGTFTDSTQSLGTNVSQWVALGDIDTDGDLDMVVANASQGNRVYTNNGLGVFADTAQALGLNESRSVVLRDMDADGDMDMVVANTVQGNRIWNNDGSGSFSDSGQSLGAYNSNSVAVGDVDGDGDLDIVTANRNQGNRVYTSSLSGTWGSATHTDSTQTLGTTDDSRSITQSDIDNDGDLDLVEANYGKANRIYINGGAGNYTLSTLASQTLGTNNSTFVVTGDLNGDGASDIVVANTGQANSTYLNDGAGNFTALAQAFNATDSNSVALGDLDGDGDLDLVAANGSNVADQLNYVYQNRGTGSFRGTSFGGSHSRSVTLGDIDGDGDLDMVVANVGTDNLVYTNNGTGGFTDSGQKLGGTDGSNFVALGDVDVDGDLDLVVANGSTPNRLYKNDGAGTFTLAQSMGTGVCKSVALGDVDGDGDLDMVTANLGADSNLVWNNDGTGSFTNSGQSLGANESYSVVLGDYDSDGDLDVAVGNSLEANRIYLNK